MSTVVPESAAKDLRRFIPYSAYKDSGVEWLGEVPAHWEINRIRGVAKSLQTGPFGSQLHADEYVVGGHPVINPANLSDGELIQDPECTVDDATAARLQHHRLRDGDILFARRGELGRCGLVRQDQEGWLCGTGCLRLRVDPAVSAPCFLMRALSTSGVADWLDLQSVGATMQNLNTFIIGRIPIVRPPIAEQQAICAFLERETARIDALLAKKDRLVELLVEKRAAFITYAVTKGLDQNVRKKDSGVEWLGEIPTHWDCLPLSRVTLSRCDGPFGSGLKSEHYVASGIRVVRLQNIGWTDFLDTDSAYIDEHYASELGDHSVVEGDLLIGGLGDDGHPVGRACVAPPGIEPAMVKADCFRFRLERRRIAPRFAAYQLSASASGAAGSLASGATRSRMNLTTMASRRIALPPMDEQQAVVHALEAREAIHLALVTKVRAAIDRLKELRAALISAAVTGKIDVREKIA